MIKTYYTEGFLVNLTKRINDYTIEILPKTSQNESLTYCAAVCREAAHAFSEGLRGLDDSAKIRKNLPSTPSSSDYFTEKPEERGDTSTQNLSCQKMPLMMVNWKG